MHLRLSRERDDHAELERDGQLALLVERRLEHLVLQIRAVRREVLEQRPIVLDQLCARGREDAVVRGGRYRAPVRFEVVHA